MSRTMNLCQLTEVIRSKNAGPYELTLDVIFKDREIYNKIKTEGLITPAMIAALYGISEKDIISFVTFDPACAIKITMIRPLPCGSIGETDVYGAQQHAPLLNLELSWD
ncbi:MAG TPA: DUF4387 domain-containing protein [Clostridia bacterium]|nr:DUF4387 domain-containing protein [Clostridia bacterium]